MAFDIFCPTKSSKSSRKSSNSNQNINRQNETAQQVDTTTNHNVPDNNPTTNNNLKSSNLNSVPCMLQVQRDFIKSEVDEINVKAGDFVLWPVPAADDPAWTRVFNIATNERGFVPTEILSEPEAYELPKKKVTRSSYHNHPHSRPHSHKPHCISERTCHSHGGSIKLHQPNHPQHFDPALNSLQGSSGGQTFQKFDHPHFQQLLPSYYNITDVNRINPQRHNNSHNECYVVMHNFVAREEDDIDVIRGEFVTVMNKDDGDWFWVKRRHDGLEGFVPANFMAPYSYVERIRASMQKGNSTVTMISSRDRDNHTYINQMPERESLSTDRHSPPPVVY